MASGIRSEEDDRSRQDATGLCNDADYRILLSTWHLRCAGRVVLSDAYLDRVNDRGRSEQSRLDMTIVLGSILPTQTRSQHRNFSMNRAQATVAADQKTPQNILSIHTISPVREKHTRNSKDSQGLAPFTRASRRATALRHPGSRLANRIFSRKVLHSAHHFL